jgi:hypothetical protein
MAGAAGEHAQWRQRAYTRGLVSDTVPWVRGDARHARAPRPLVVPVTAVAPQRGAAAHLGHFGGETSSKWSAQQFYLALTKRAHTTLRKVELWKELGDGWFEAN